MDEDCWQKALIPLPMDFWGAAILPGHLTVKISSLGLDLGCTGEAGRSELRAVLVCDG